MLHVVQIIPRNGYGSQRQGKLCLPLSQSCPTGGCRDSLTNQALQLLYYSEMLLQGSAFWAMDLPSSTGGMVESDES